MRDEDYYNEIIKELDNAELSIKVAKDILSITKSTKIVETNFEFDEAINKVASFLSKKQDPNSLRGMKHRLLNGKKELTVKEAYEVQEKFGIPISAWKDIAWFKKNLLPKQI